MAFSCIVPTVVRAVVIDITTHPSSVSSDPFNIDVYISDPSPATNYLRVDLYKEGTTNYFGETYNGSAWYGGLDGLQYFPIEIGPESTASATLQSRVGSPSNSEYPGPGEYKLRIRRYTASGNSASGDSQTPVNIQIIVSTPTPEPTPSPTVEPAPTSSPTPTPTLIPTSTPTPTPTKKSTASPSGTQEVISAEEGGDESLILGLREELDPEFSEDSSQEEIKRKFPVLAIFLILGGTGLVGFAAYSFLKGRKKGYNIKKKEENGEGELQE